MIYRYALSYLETWKKNPMRKPLILRGARQVGKTTLVENFATEFDCFLKLNLDEEEDRLLFTRYKEIHRLIEAIFFHLQKIRQREVPYFSSMKSKTPPKPWRFYDIFMKSDRIFMSSLLVLY